MNFTEEETKLVRETVREYYTESGGQVIPNNRYTQPNILHAMILRRLQGKPIDKDTTTTEMQEHLVEANLLGVIEGMAGTYTH